MSRFYEVRMEAITRWQLMTGRTCHPFYDDINDAYECKWQGFGEPHVTIFCSLGVWSECLSQLLQDERYDEVDLSNEDEAGADLYSYYNQILLITSEIIDDIS